MVELDRVSADQVATEAPQLGFIVRAAPLRPANRAVPRIDGRRPPRARSVNAPRSAIGRDRESDGHSVRTRTSPLGVGMGWQLRGALVFMVFGLAALAPSPARADRAFTARFTTNDTGNIAIAAAPLMACSTTGTNGAQCANARGLDASNGPAGATNIDSQNNNNYTMVGVDTDGYLVTTTSTAMLALPRVPRCCSPGLYWGADQLAGNNGGAAPPPATANVRQALFKPPGSTYRAVTATTLDSGTGNNTNRYQAFVDVTAAVAAAGGGTYSVGNVRAGTGGDRYAGWSLVVAYRDTAQPARNLTVFDGLTTIASNAAPTTIPVSGLDPAGRPGPHHAGVRQL